MGIIVVPGRVGLALLVIGAFCMAGIWVVRTFSEGRTEHAMEDVQRALGPFVASDEMRQLADGGALLRVVHPELPQVTAPDHAFDGSAPTTSWAAYEVDRTAAEPPITPDARGIVVECRSDGSLAIDQHTVFLPEARRAETPEDVAWIAFLHYSENDRFWVLRPGGTSLATERIDVRVVARVGGRRIGRVTAEGAPPPSGGNPAELFQPHPALVARTIVQLLDDPEPAPTIVLRPDELACADTVMPAAFGDTGDLPRSCVLGATSECVEACGARDAGACLAAAYTMQHGWLTGARRLHRLACVAGSVEGCMQEESLRLGAQAVPSGDETACALRVYRRACDAGDAGGCSSFAAMSPPAP